MVSITEASTLIFQVSILFYKSENADQIYTP